MTEDERKMLRDMHEFWFAPPVKGQRTRAEEIHEMLTAKRAMLWAGRALLWLSAVLAAAGAVWANFKGFWEPPGK